VSERFVQITLRRKESKLLEVEKEYSDFDSLTFVSLKEESNSPYPNKPFACKEVSMLSY
jgi:hypothetical protein